MIILGSVAKDDKGFLIETKFYTSGGKLILSQLTRARSAGDINGAAKEITAAVLEKFPFEGTVIGTEGERYRVNIGKALQDQQGHGVHAHGAPPRRERARSRDTARRAGSRSRSPRTAAPGPRWKT